MYRAIFPHRQISRQVLLNRNWPQHPVFSSIHNAETPVPDFALDAIDTVQYGASRQRIPQLVPIFHRNPQFSAREQRLERILPQIPEWSRKLFVWSQANSMFGFGTEEWPASEARPQTYGWKWRPQSKLDWIVNRTVRQAVLVELVSALPDDWERRG